jgi:hypothetical protein
VVFIGVHMPSYLKDHGLAPQVATTALALIGLFNVFGTYTAGLLGQRMAKRHILSGIYLLRSVVIVLFLWAPLTPLSVYLFAAVMGFLWLSTVPPTNAIVAQVFGVQYMSMLGGIVFFSHQIGSFLGVWLGGWLYDLTGSYDVVWWIAVAWACSPAWPTSPCAKPPSCGPRGRGLSPAPMPSARPAARPPRRWLAGWRCWRCWPWCSWPICAELALDLAGRLWSCF